MGELSILSPRPEVVVVDGAKVKVHPVMLRDFERFGRASAGLFQMLGSVSVEDIGAYAERHADELAEVLVATTDLSAKAVSRLSVATNGDEASSVASLSLDCPLCSTAHAPPPAVQPLALLHQPLAYRLQPQVAARIAALTAPPLPARGPPYSL